jgi:hypothetical protein
MPRPLGSAPPTRGQRYVARSKQHLPPADFPSARFYADSPSMSYRARSFSAVISPAFGWLMLRLALVTGMLIRPASLQAQAHDHSTPALTPADARLTLVLGGPHLILYHRGYLALDDAQVTGLQRLRRAVCDAEVAYVAQSDQWRARLSALIGDTTPRASTPPFRDALTQLATAESQWLSVLMQTRRDALALLTTSQRAQTLALRDHWARESMAMIDEATRPGQRGHPGTQIPIRVPAMVVGTTTLLPYCEVLHGPSSHISIPPPR